MNWLESLRTKMVPVDSWFNSNGWDVTILIGIAIGLWIFWAWIQDPRNANNTIVRHVKSVSFTFIFVVVVLVWLFLSDYAGMLALFVLSMFKFNKWWYDKKHGGK